MTELPVLAGPRITLRAPRASDEAERLALGHDPQIVHMFGGDPSGVIPMTRQDAFLWLDRVRHRPLAWIVEHDRRLLGHVRAIGFCDYRKSWGE